MTTEITWQTVIYFYIKHLEMQIIYFYIFYFEYKYKSKFMNSIFLKVLFNLFINIKCITLKSIFL